MGDIMTTSVDHLSPDVLAGYAAGTVDERLAWSVEAHLTACAQCRSSIAAYADAGRLARNRSIVLVGTALPAGGRLRRLLAATPSLRRSWLLSVAGVLAVVVAEALLLHHVGSGPPGGSPGRAELLPFLCVGPLLVLAGVAAAFLPVFDPAHDVAAAAPTSGFTLLLIRAASALLAALVLVACCALFLPGPGWLPAALLLPSLALCGVALAAATVVGPVTAAVGPGAIWVLALLLLGVRHPPLLILQWNGQAVSAAVLLAAAAVVWTRRDRFEWGWPVWA
jgi:hypothetical protein